MIDLRNTFSSCYDDQSMHETLSALRRSEFPSYPSRNKSFKVPP